MTAGAAHNRQYAAPISAVMCGEYGWRIDGPTLGLGPVERLGCLVEFGVHPRKDHRQGDTPCRNPLQV